MKGENSSRQKRKTIKEICVQKCPAIYLEELSSIVDTLNKIGVGLPDNDQSELYNLTSAMAMRTAGKIAGAYDYWTTQCIGTGREDLNVLRLCGGACWKRIIFLRKELRK
jgi:hypothetical protein